MKKKDNQNDSWSSILSDLGLEQEQSVTAAVERQGEKEAEIEVKESVTSETRKTSEPKSDPPIAASIGSFGAGILDDAPLQKEEPQPSTEAKPDEEKSGKSRSGKKRFFDRFPKMNLFGSPKESLESVVEGTKAPSLGGKSFTSNTLEKVPHATSRQARQEEKEEPAAVENEFLKTGDEKKETPKDENNPWSDIAAQVGFLSTSQEPVTEAEKSGFKGRKRDEEPKRDRQQDRQQGRQRGRRNIPSLFEQPTPEPEESATLKNMMKTGDVPDREAEQRLHSMFDVEKPVEDNEAPRRQERARRDREPRNRDNRSQENRSHDNRSRENRSRNTAAETVDDVIREAEDVRKPSRDAQGERPRGRRGSRYTDQESRDVEETRETRRSEPAWNLDEEPSTPPRSRQRGRREENGRREDGERPEREERKESRQSESSLPAVPQKSIPSWDDAINMLVDANIARHGQRPPRKNGGRR